MTQELGDSKLPVLNHNAKESILFHICYIIAQLDPENVVSTARRQWMAKHLTEFILSAALKFIAGQKEHGDNLESVDLLREIRGEHLDAFWYHAAYSDPLNKPVITNE